MGAALLSSVEIYHNIDDIPFPYVHFLSPELDGLRVDCSKGDGRRFSPSVMPAHEMIHSFLNWLLERGYSCKIEQTKEGLFKVYIYTSHGMIPEPTHTKFSFKIFGLSGTKDDHDPTDILQMGCRMWIDNERIRLVERRPLRNYKFADCVFLGDWNPQEGDSLPHDILEQLNSIH